MEWSTEAAALFASSSLSVTFAQLHATTYDDDDDDDDDDDEVDDNDEVCGLSGTRLRGRVAQ